jgi:hypothetical protein
MKMQSAALLARIGEKHCIAALALTFTILAILVAAAPYDPSTDLADATTNDIWIEHYSHGIYHIPFSEWTYGQTQSVVVEYRGEYVVVNEKGPGHVMAMIPFRSVGAEFLFAPTMAALAVAGTYMLGRRLFGWPAGFIASLLVMFNLSVVVMWHRYYWTDASTMHFLVFSVWLFVEGIYRFNGRSLDPNQAGPVSPREKLLGLGLGALAGIFFGISVSTRYPTGLLVAIFPLFLFGFYLKRMSPDIRGKRIAGAIRKGLPAIVQLGAFALGLALVLVPLMQYNATYFGGPFNSGYDATLLFKFDPAAGLESRNTSTVWTGDIGSYVSTAFGNLVLLAPMFLARMPALVFLPVGLYCMRRKKPELAMLSAWIGINFYTYLSLEWVDMYAHPHLMPWEPRYWMPSLPAIAIIAGLAIHRLSKWLVTRWSRRINWPDAGLRAGRVLAAGAIAGALVLLSAVPSLQYIAEPPAAGHQPQQALVVTTDQLLKHPEEFLGRQVILANATVTAVILDGVIIQSAGSEARLPVRFVEWPPGSQPQFAVGDNVAVRGVFVREPAPPGMPPRYHIGVKYGTQDFARLITP